MIIGFTGLKGSGKDTAGAYLVEKYGFTRISFADKLKQSAAACFGINPGAWDHLKNKTNAFVEVKIYIDPLPTEVASITVREFLQRYGTEAHRDIFGPDFWVKEALNFDWSEGDYVFTDVRFPNEAEAIKERRGYVIQVTRKGSVKDTHASEIDLPSALIDGKIANNGTKEKMYVLLDTLVERLRLEEDSH